MKDLDKKIVVEPLDEVRVARIERRLLQGGRSSAAESPPSRLRSWAWPAVSMALAASLIAVVWRGANDTVGAPEPPPTEMAVETGDTSSTVEVGGARIDVGPRSRAVVENQRQIATRVRVRDGHVRFVVYPRSDRSTFTVEAADTLVTVIGTVFSVERRGDEVAVEVEHGKVAVERRGKRVLLAAGDSWASEGFKSAVAVASTPATAPGDEGASGDEGEEPKQVEPKQVEPKQVEPKQVEPRVARPSQVAAPKLEPDAGPAVSFSPYRAPSVLDPIMESPGGNFAEVERFYREQSLVRGDSERAAFAVYSTAYWQLYRMRNARAALHTAKLYERRFRRGKNAESVLWVRLAALCATGKDSECRAAGHSYNRRYPGGRFARQVKAVINREPR